MGSFLEMAKSILLKAKNKKEILPPLKLDYKNLVAGFAGDLAFGPLRAADPADGTVFKLEKPMLYYRDGNLKGWATLSVPGTPSHLNDPLKIDLRMNSVDIGVSGEPVVLSFRNHSHNGVQIGVGAQAPVAPEANFRGQARMLGIVTTDWRLRIGYDSNRLSQAFQQVIDSRGSKKSVTNAQAELGNPGFDFSALAQVSLPLIGKVPLSKLSFNAPTTRALKNPLMGSSFRFPYSYRAAGMVPTPPGTLFDIWAAGLGYSSASFNATRGKTFNVALLPSISVEGKSLVEKFPVYGYLEYSRIKKVHEGLEVGFRLTLSPSSVDFARLRGSSQRDQADIVELTNRVRKLLEDKSKPKSMFNLEVFGRHGWLDGD